MSSFPIVLLKKKKKNLVAQDVGETVGKRYIDYWWECKLIQLL